MMFTMPMLAGYFRDLFTLDEGDGSLAFLPYLVTAVAVGVLLAAGYFTFWRAQESKLLRRLLAQNAVGQGNAKSLTDLGYRPGTLDAKITLHALRSPACALYRNTSSAELDALTERFSHEGYEEQKEAPKNDTSGTDAESTSTPARDPKAEAREARAAAKRRRNMGLRLAVNQDTALYIPEEKRTYVEEHAAKFTTDDWMGLVYAACGVLLVWFLVLNLLKPLAAWLTR